MREIDGKKYITATEYAEMKNMNTSRVSQLKKTGELPFVEFKDMGISLIDFELLELSNHDKRLALAKMLVPNEIQKMSMMDVGRYFTGTLNELLDYKTNNEIVVTDLKKELQNSNENVNRIEKELREKNEILQVLEQQKESYKLTIEHDEKKIAELEKLKSDLVEKNTTSQDLINANILLIKDLEFKNSSLIVENNSLKESNKGLVEALTLNKSNALNANFEQVLSNISTSLDAIKKNTLMPKSNNTKKAV